MGRVCDCCGYERRNETFGGKGNRARVCSDCRKLPKTELQRILAENEILGFIDQANISQKNIARLHSLASIDDAEFQELRTLILEIAQLAPHKRRRWKLIASIDSNLLDRVIEAGLASHCREPVEFESFEDLNLGATSKWLEVDQLGFEIPD